MKCGKKSCGKQKSLKQLCREIAILTGFYQQQPAYRVATDLGVDYQSVTRVYQRLREAIYHVDEFEGGKLKGEIEMDESYFGGRRKGKRGRGATRKSIVFGLLERNGRVYTKVLEQVTADELMAHIKKHTRKGSVYYTDTFRSYNSLKRLGKHHKINHTKAFVYRAKNHINGIEGFWSYAKHILYNYRGVSKYHFPMYLKEVEYWYNHRNENLFKEFMNIYFGYVSH
ncbi:MAG: DDE transposase [Candidatus Magasanikbacteria bacterium CG10_big_fil_rev_8_21_14_0_10_40_10]|uniref:DDE transposase n=1 Tax=Candidatus Magasanikbacteria bacterium CG10_big_fil_rev_8_21_14_0_10_40_10 TaxID=1974648 RepID=A0A2M6W3E1_9BACT|nr:MAG: DDE transposase [Candidatus Magasanikbacteria bacterium CG10_big_fil_rev_8_21_14_0_10_40_10]